MTGLLWAGFRGQGKPAADSITTSAWQVYASCGICMHADMGVEVSLILRASRSSKVTGSENQGSGGVKAVDLAEIWEQQ